MSDVGEVSVKITADASGVDRAISNVKGQFSQLSNDLTGIAKGFNLDNVASQIDKISDKFKGLGSTLAISAAPFEIYGALAVKAFSDFEQGIAKINTLLPDATKAEMEAVGEQLKAFSSEFGADINDAIQAYYDALSAGVAQGDVLPFMETAQKAGVAGMSDVSVAVDGLTSILNSYQKKTSEAENVSDVMFKTVELGKIEFEQLAANIGKVAPTAAQFKIGFEDVGAAIASITSQGLKPEQTMTVLTSLISQLGKSGTDLSDKFKEITGQSFPDFIASGGTLADAIGKIRDYSQDTGTSLMDMTGNLEAAKGLAMLGGSAFEQYAGFLDEISDSAGATETAYSKMSETMAFAMDQLKAQMQTTMIEVGDALAPVVKDFTKWLSENSDEISDFAISIAQNAVPAIEGLFDIMKKLMDFFNNLPAGTKSLLAQLLGVGAVGAAIGGPALYGAGIALGPVSSLVKLLGSLTVPTTVATEVGAIGTAATTAAGSGGVGALTTALSGLGAPVVLGAIAGIGLGLAAYTTNFGDFRDNVNSVISELGQAAQNISSGDYESAGRDCAEAFSKGLETVVDLTSATISALPGALTALGEFKSGMEQAAQEAVSGFTSKITGDLLTTTNEYLKSIVLTGPEIVFEREKWKTNVDGAISEIKGALSGIDLNPEGNAAANSFIDGFLAANFGPMSSAVKGALEGVIDGVIDFAVDSVAGQDQKKREIIKEKLPIIGGYVDNTKQYEEEVGRSISTSIEQLKKELIESGITPYAAERQATTQYYQNRNLHSRDSSKDVTTATETGTKDGMVNAAPEVAQQTGKSVAEALAKEKGWYDKGQLDVQMAENFLAKNPAFAEQYSAKLKESSESIQDLKNEIQANQRELNAQTSQIKDNAGTTTKLDAEQLKLIDSVNSTSNGIFQFSEPVKIAGDSTGKLADGSDKATGALQTFADTLGSLDIKSIIQSWLGEGELGQAAQNKANDLSQLYGKDVSKQLTTGLATTISKELPKWVNWQKEDKGQSFEDVSKNKSDLWYEFANAVLKSSYAGYRDLGTRDWTFRQDVDSKLNPDTLKMTDELFRKAIDTYVKPFYDGTLKAEPGKDWLGNSDVQNNSKYYSNDWKFVNEGMKETGTEAKTTTPQINTLNSALEKIGLTGSGLTDVLSNVDQALSDHRASILESEDYLSKYNQAAGENTKYTQDQERQTYSLMNSLGMLGTAQDMYNNYMSDGILDATEASHVQQALASATKMMGDAGITAEGGISGLPGALQALASAAQAAMSQIQAAISQAQSAASAAASGWKMQTSPTKYPTMAPSSPTNFNINMSNNTFPTGTKPSDVMRDINGMLRITA